ncbi:MAG: hypothetical protein WED86_02900 [Chloroflexota bacterium]
MPIRTLRAAAAASLISLLAAATACVPQQQPPADCAAEAVERQTTLGANRLDPSSIDVCRGQRVTLDVVAEQDGVIHLHGYDEEAQATEVHSGETVQLAFVAARSGQFIIELHTLSGTAVEVGILTVHEP